MPKKKPPTKAEREHMGRIKMMPCIVCCHAEPSDCHHITRNGRRLGHFFTLPLCKEHHDLLTTLGIPVWERKFGSQMHLLGLVCRILGIGMPALPGKTPFSQLPCFD